MIPTTSRRSPVYTGTGAPASYAFGFKVFSKSDVAVRVTDTNGVETTWTLDAQYTVALNADQDNFPGGTVTPTGALATGYSLVIVGNQSYSQTTQFPNGGAFNAVTVERALDRIVIMSQQLAESAGRALQIPPAEAGVPVQLPVAALRAGKVLVFDVNGDVTVSVNNLDDLNASAAASANAAAGSAGAAAVSAGNAASSERQAAAIVLGNFLQSGSTQARTFPEKVREIEVSVMDFMTPAQRADVLAGTALIDVAAAVNTALMRYAATPGVGRVKAPSGKYRIESTVTVPEHMRLVGDLSDSFGAGMPGTEFAWYGPSGSTAVITSTSDENDWSRAGIEDIRIKNYTAAGTGYGLRVRNPQNGSYLRNVFVNGFPERQVFVYEPAGRAVAGTCPGYFFMDNVFCIGGLVPLELQASVEQIVVSNLGVDTDATSTKGILVTKAPLGQLQRAPVKFIGCKVEIQQVSPDIDGIVWDNDLAISFDTVAVQRNDNIASTKSAFLYTGVTRNIPTVELHNCTSWNLQNLFKFNAAGVAKAAGAINTQESFSYGRNNPVTCFVFTKDTLTASMNSNLNTAGDANLANVGYTVHRPCIIEGVAARHTAAITAGSITMSVVKNGATFVQAILLNSANQGRHNDMAGAPTTINGPQFQFAPGDRITTQITTTADIAPLGGHVVLEVFVRWL